MKKTISEIESIIEARIAEHEEEYELDNVDRNDIREEEYRKGGWKSAKEPPARLGLFLVVPVFR